MDDGDLFGGLGADPVPQKAESSKPKAVSAPKTPLPNCAALKKDVLFRSAKANKIHAR